MCKSRGIVNANDSIISGFAYVDIVVLPKIVQDNAMGSYPDSIKGFFNFTFDTTEPIKDIIIGTYSDYAKSNYDAFLHSGVSSIAI